MRTEHSTKHVRGIQQVALLATRPKGVKGRHSGKVDVFLLKGELRDWGAGHHSPVSGPFQVWMHAVAHSPLSLEPHHR